MQPKYYKSFNRAARLAKGPKWQRFAANPLHYIFLQGFRRIAFPLTHRPLTINCRLFWGEKVKIVLPGSADLFLLGCKSDDSEIRLTRLLLKQLQRGDHFLDAGAHIGYYSLLAAYLCGQEGRVIAVEAAPATFRLLESNMSGHSMVTVVHKALSQKKEQLNFTLFPPPYEEYNTMNAQQYAGTGWIKKIKPQTCVADALPGDQLLEQYLCKPAIIKIDVEGGEAAVITGLQQYLKTQNPLVIMEFVCSRRNNQTHRDADALLRQWGYVPCRIDDDGSLVVIERDVAAMVDACGLESDNIVYTK